MSPRIQHLLSDIKHPKQDLSHEDLAYSLTFDQNMLNSLLVEVSMATKWASIRKAASLFDRQAHYIKMMNTNLLKLNMP